MTVSPSRSWCARGIGSVHEGEFEHAAISPSDSTSRSSVSPVRSWRPSRHATDGVIVYPKHQERFLGLQAEPVALAALEEAKRAAFDAHRFGRSVRRVPERLFRVRVRQTHQCIQWHDIKRLVRSCLFRSPSRCRRPGSRWRHARAACRRRRRRPSRRSGMASGPIFRAGASGRSGERPAQASAAAVRARRRCSCRRQHEWRRGESRRAAVRRSAPRAAACRTTAGAGDRFRRRCGGC